ncbi:DUF190 domain-containing protein [Nitratidesulfovibrio liaohensis]|jgi:CBS domain-containing protein|uniref:DUF190 domain-containing protein n=1 Tax=Nitratidesulfovibrio liaohensis TaxID=2604158 RepID=A0ABY9QYP2_9BACT|nr:DUF190 domain-containing protein [Nitratidesulfovibrio liaohensis]WMW64658.1 DUF190 domain-containing protein [Nitratidesulfovibrio liaohensis]
MKIHGEAEVLRIYIGESDQHSGRLLHEAIVEEARRRGMAGATVMRGLMGFGANSLVHTAKILRLSEDLPILVEIVDKSERIDAFLPCVEDMVSEGTMTRQKVQAIFHCTMRVRDVMTSPVVSVQPDTPLPDVIDLLLRQGIKAVPVIKGRKIVGMITGGDLLGRGGMGLRLSVHGELPEEMRQEEAQRLAVAGKTAGDVMSSPVTTVNIHARVPEAAAIMAKKGLKRLPVVDDTGELAGILSRIDVLRTISTATSVADEIPPQLPQGLARTARDVMFGNVPSVRPDAPLDEALRKLVSTPLRRVVVVDAEQKVVGIVLDRDLVRRFSAQKRPGLLQALTEILSFGTPAAKPLGVTVAEAMQTTVFTIAADTPVATVLQRMLESGSKRLVVVDAEEKLLGMVDRDTVLGIIGGA